MFVTAWRDSGAGKLTAAGDRHRQQQLIGEVRADRRAELEVVDEIVDRIVGDVLGGVAFFAVRGAQLARTARELGLDHE